MAGRSSLQSLSLIILFAACVIAARIELELSKQLLSERGNLVERYIPKNLNWCNNNGTNYCNPVRNQHVPQYCGSCYAFAITNSFSDRLRIMGGDFVTLSPQNLLSCAETATCFGAEPSLVLKYICDVGVPDETCSPYLADEFFKCMPDNECYTFDTWKARRTIPNGEFKRYFGSDFGVIQGEDELLNMMQDGPIICTINAIEPFEKWNSTKIFTEKGSTIPDHTIEVVGYGVEDGLKYWLIKNSWGTAWNYPMQGYIKIQRGVNLLGIEDFCKFSAVNNRPHGFNLFAAFSFVLLTHLQLFGHLFNSKQSLRLLD